MIVKSFGELEFSKLMQVYAESNRCNGKEQYHDESPQIQLHNAEMDFYHYLNSVFFHQKNSLYCIWATEGKYRAALRLEPYNDGLLLCALETEPNSRRQGFATSLICETQKYLSRQGSGILYSHVSKRNTASLAAHKRCGFQIEKDFAVYADGSVLHNHFTLTYEYEKTEIH